METRVVKVGDVLIGGNHPIVVQTMCNTHTYDVDATVAQTLRLAAAGAQLVRITVPGLQDVPHIREIKDRVRAAGCNVPLVADIHFSSETAIAVASVVERSGSIRATSIRTTTRRGASSPVSWRNVRSMGPLSGLA